MKMAPTAVVVALATLSARSMLTMLIPKIFVEAPLYWGLFSERQRPR